MQVVIFTLGKDSYAVEALAVQEILRKPEPVILPEAPPYIAGMVDFRGKTIPLVHLGKLLNLPAAEVGQRAIVLDGDGFVAAFQVDDVNDVLNIPDHALDPVPNVALGSTTVPKAVARLKDRMIVVIDPVKLLIKSQSAFR